MEFAAMISGLIGQLVEYAWSFDPDHDSKGLTIFAIGWIIQIASVYGMIHWVYITYSKMNLVRAKIFKGCAFGITYVRDKVQQKADLKKQEAVVQAQESIISAISDNQTIVLRFNASTLLTYHVGHISAALVDAYIRVTGSPLPEPFISLDDIGQPQVNMEKLPSYPDQHMLRSQAYRGLFWLLWYAATVQHGKQALIIPTKNVKDICTCFDTLGAEVDSHRVLITVKMLFSHALEEGCDIAFVRPESAKSEMPQQENQFAGV